MVMSTAFEAHAAPFVRGELVGIMPPASENVPWMSWALPSEPAWLSQKTPASETTQTLTMASECAASAAESDGLVVGASHVIAQDGQPQGAIALKRARLAHAGVRGDAEDAAKSVRRRRHESRSACRRAAGAHSAGQRRA